MSAGQQAENIAPVIPIRREDPINEVFGPGGVLARHSSTYEPRAGQVQLARAIEQAIREEKAALLEGPCGTGKSIGYLVPAIQALQSGRASRVVVSTASIALQEQLATKDLPTLRTAMGHSFEHAVLKGRSNYLCIDRATRTSVNPPFDVDVSRLVRWSRETRTGDKSELPFVPAEDEWRHFSVDSDECKGKDCQFARDCFARAADSRAAKAQIVVTNHHLLCADAMLYELAVPEPVRPLAKFDLLIVDEAHEVADIGRDFFGATITKGGLRSIARWIEKHGEGKEAAEEFERVANLWIGDLTRWTHAVLSAQRDRQERAHIDRAEGFPLECRAIELAREVLEIQRAAKGLEEELDAEEKDGPLSDDEREERAASRSTARRAWKLFTWLRLLEAPELHPDVCLWAEIDRRGDARLQGRTVFVADVLNRALWSRQTSILCSATLTTGGTFDFLHRETGVDDEAIELAVESPFDHANRCLLVTPPVPDPKSEGWPGALATIVRQVVRIANGRTLALFSSRRMRDATFQAVRDTQRTWLLQGELPSRVLAEKFRADRGSVLFGTRSFWTGLDIPGDALLAVVIDRVPFPMPDDPIVRRIHAKLGSKAFGEYDLPRATMQLRQGVGRLIRTRSDYGVIVLCDSRLWSSKWGASVMRSLPKCRRAAGPADVKAHLDRFRVVGGAS